MLNQKHQYECVKGSSITLGRSETGIDYAASSTLPLFNVNCTMHRDPLRIIVACRQIKKNKRAPEQISTGAGGGGRGGKGKEKVSKYVEHLVKKGKMMMRKVKVHPRASHECKRVGYTTYVEVRM